MSLLREKQKRLAAFLVTLLILFLLVTIVYNKPQHLENNSQNRLASYDGKFYWVDEGTSLENHPIGPDVLEVSYDPTISTDHLFLLSMTSERTGMLNLEDFEKFINGRTVREATQNEKMNVELYKKNLKMVTVLIHYKLKVFQR